MLRRLLMRRAYNSQHWEKARSHAFKLINIPKEQQLARSIIVRSFFNQRRYEDVIKYVTDWKDKTLVTYEERARDYLWHNNNQNNAVNFEPPPRIKQLQTKQPRPPIEVDWNASAMADNFIQVGERVWFRHPDGYVFWDMPVGFSLNKTHPDLLRLTAETLLYPWEKSTQKPFEGTRSTGNNVGLSYSAGTDSTAAAIVMPENTILAYHRRSYTSLLDHRNAERMIKHMKQDRGKEVVLIDSNHELIRTFHNKQMGFSSDFASGSHLILLADYLDLAGIAFGMPIDNTWLWKGRKFRHFQKSEFFQYWKNRFLDAGLELYLPIAGVSEAGAMIICEKYGVTPFLNSCMRGDGLEGCGRCWKCFHKNGPLGRPFDIDSHEISTFLQRRPMPTTTHALWALQTMNYGHKVPDLDHLLDRDYSWWTKVYPHSKEILPELWREETWMKICQYLELMDEPYEVESINHFSE